MFFLKYQNALSILVVQERHVRVLFRYAILQRLYLHFQQFQSFLRLVQFVIAGRELFVMAAHFDAGGDIAAILITQSSESGRIDAFDNFQTDE